MVVVETERLLFREVELQDVAAFLQLDSDPLVHRYLGNKPITDLKQIEEIILSVQHQYRENGVGRWAVLEKDTQAFIGWAGLKLVKEPVNQHCDFYDLAYRLLPNYWNKGYGTESAAAALKYGFINLRLQEIFASARVANLASNKILQKSGFTHLSSYPYDGEVNNWYCITRHEYESLSS